MTTSETSHFGLTRVGQGEQLSKNGYAFGDLDRLAIDNILYAAITHSHDGSNRLTDPTVAVGLTTASSGGSLPAGTTLYYRASLVDKYGLETQASTEAVVTTPPPISPPSAPSGNIETTSGTIGPGTWSYQVTYITATGGETTTSSPNNLVVVNGTTNRIVLTLPALPAGASGYRIYRQRPGQTQFYYLDQVATSLYYDTSLPEDSTITAPTVNTTNSTNAVTVTVPGGTIPIGCMGWKIYRALDSGGYDGNSLVHFVVEGSSDISTDITTTYVDTGDALLAGYPRDVSSTIPGGTVVNLSQIVGQIPLASAPRGSRVVTAFAPGVVANQSIITMTNTPVPIVPIRLTAYFQQPLTDVGVHVKIRVLDTQATPNFVELDCVPAAATPTTPIGYYDLKFPDYLAQVYEAELGTRSNTANVPVVTDVQASNGQAVALDLTGEYVQQSLGVLAPGSYSLFATVKVPTYATNTNDLTIQAIKVSDGTVIATTSYTPGTSPAQSANYLEYAGPTFTATGTDEVALRVLKSTTSTQSYYVDSYRYSAQVPQLAAGDITVQAFVTGGTNTSAANVNVSLWF